MISANLIFLVACHIGSAEHFAVFAKELQTKGFEVEIFASEEASKKFTGLPVKRLEVFSLNQLSEQEKETLAYQIAKKCQKASCVLMDVGHSFNARLQRKIKEEAPSIERIVYYDNPEAYVPGGYSKTAKEVMELASKVLFANANLEHAKIYEDLESETFIPPNKKIGIGYYAVSSADQIVKRRKEEKKSLTADLLRKYGIEAKEQQKLLVYFGGNNQEYFEKAFPAFLKSLKEALHKSDLSSYVLFLQQHPGAKATQMDRKALELWIQELGDKRSKAPQIAISEETTADMQVIADTALYYQTSMGPLLALAGVQTLQVGHEVYPDVLVKSEICSVATTADKLLAALKKTSLSPPSESERGKLYQLLGIRKDWGLNLEKALEKNDFRT
jgi:hypothetical protein